MSNSAPQSSSSKSSSHRSPSISSSLKACVKEQFSGTSGSTRELDPRRKHSGGTRPSTNLIKEMFQGTSGSTRESSSRSGPDPERQSVNDYYYPKVSAGSETSSRVSSRASSRLPSDCPSAPRSSSRSGSTSDGSSSTWYRPRADSPHPGQMPDSSSDSMSLEGPPSPYFGSGHPRSGSITSYPTSGAPGRIINEVEDPKWKKHEKVAFAICQSMGGPELPDHRPKRHGGR